MTLYALCNWRGFAAMAPVVALALAAEPEPPAIAASARLEDRYPERRVDFPGDVSGLADVTYSVPGGFRPLTLDLYLPPSRTNPAPAIVYVHGGGWFSGHARHGGAFENWPRVLAGIAARGYVVASINYRLSGEATFPAAAQDVRSAIRWLRANASRYSIDERRIGIWGASAGGQLAALAGTGCDLPALDATADTTLARESACVQAVVTWYGVFDLAPLLAKKAGPTPETRYLGCSASPCSEAQILLASPIRHIDRSDPPFLLVHGARDQTVAAAQSADFHAALQSHGVKSQLLVIDGVDHSFVGANPEATRAASLQALRATTDFFDRVLQARASR
jgi:acetyl esterase/lipase